MKFKTTLQAAVSALALSTTAAFADIDVDRLAMDYLAKGYDRVEVKVGVTQVKVEAVMGNAKIEVIYDKETGAILKSETSRVSGTNDVSDGVSVSSASGDFLDDESDEEGDDEEDDDEESDKEDDDEEDDDEEDDDEEDDDEDDDDEEDDEN